MIRSPSNLNKELGDIIIKDYSKTVDNKFNKVSEIISDTSKNRARVFLKEKKLKNKKQKGSSIPLNSNLQGAPFQDPFSPRRSRGYFTGQTPDEINQFGNLPNNDWSQTVGRPLGAIAQLRADSTGPGTGGSKKRTTKKKMKLKGGKDSFKTSNLIGTNYYDKKNSAGFDLPQTKRENDLNSLISNNNVNRFYFPAFFSQFDKSK